ncbi:MAG: exodeoxyribonuclease V subunit alpha [Candidatus Macondimonas sp.]|jgi:exodeoxyribonuclease V alpha subunit
MTPVQAGWLRTLRAAGDFEEFDLQLAAVFARQDASLPLPGLWAIARLSQQTQRGAVCVTVTELTGAPPPVLPAGTTWPAQADDWTALLRGFDAVGTPGQVRPLILDQAGRLYGYRHWDLEQRLACALRRRTQWDPLAEAAALRAGLGRLFPDVGPEVPLQGLAAALAATGRITVLTGGPGTGKTTTLARMLALLLHLKADLRVALVAPTGKAAARMQEALGAALARLPPEWHVDLPTQATTLHRLLGLRPGAAHLPRFHRDHPLPVDVLALDEASMVDLGLMTRLLEALPDSARLIVLGDPDQLASVEAGAVLGDLCEHAAGLRLPQAQRLATLTGWPVPAGTMLDDHPLRDHRVHLTHNYRFGDSPGLARLAAAVNMGDARAVQTLLAGAGAPEVMGLDGSSGEAGLIEQVMAGYAPHLDALARGAPAEEVLVLFEAFRVLCAHRVGHHGVEGINARIETALRRAGRLRGEGMWSPGRPVLVTRNDPGARIANGDVGLILPAVEGGLQVVFRRTDGTLHRISPARLGSWESAFAMTIHKTQGSEFDEVLLVLPPEDSPLLTRNLLYTGVTRARRRLRIIGAPEIWAKALARRQTRASGLAAALRQTDDAGASRSDP